MKNKFIVEKATDIYNKIKVIEESLSKDKFKDNPDKSHILEIGSKGLKSQELNIELFTTIDIYLNMVEGSIEDFSEEIQAYYNFYQSLKQPASDKDSEDIKKIKEYINSLKKDG